MKVLVTGFGPFPGVPRNPSVDVVRALQGRRVGDVDIVAREIPVSWSEGPDLAVATAREIGASLVIGVGVAESRDAVTVERQGRRAWSQIPDARGATCAGLEGPEIVPATLDVERLAGALRAGVSDDAGAYVCNAWLYRVAQALDVPVGFVHIPAEGIDPELLVEGVRALLEA